MSNGNGHTPYPLPHIVAGGAAGGVKGNRHLVAPEHSPNANLMLSVADKFGLELDRFGVSTGRARTVTTNDHEPQRSRRSQSKLCFSLWSL